MHVTQHVGEKKCEATIISLTCVSSETQNLQHIVGHILYTNGGSLCQALLAETVESGTKNRCMIKVTHI